jgi:phenylpropionate dioxygenase-like ring-hydroxylating dioxygenase large terminal subunit
MAALDHWHPLYLSKNLKNDPVRVILDGTPIALYRQKDGTATALADECPHRRMRLSLGCVQEDRLQCRYHGWTFTPDGNGESPGTPKLHACITSYDVREESGAIWVKGKEAEASFPVIDHSGYLPMGALQQTVKAPLELVLDNFCEIEHTATTHAVFGYELDRMAEVEVRFLPTEETVRVVNQGPAKTVSRWLRPLIGVQKGDQFHDDWTTYFSPVYSVYDHWWTNPQTGKESKVRWRIYIFFTPVGECETQLTTFAFAKSTWPIGEYGGLRLFRWLMRKHLAREIQFDIDMLESLANYDTGIEGMKLSRFDRVLGLNRDRINKIYRRNKTGRKRELA